MFLCHILIPTQKRAAYILLYICPLKCFSFYYSLILLFSNSLFFYTLDIFRRDPVHPGTAHIAYDHISDMNRTFDLNRLQKFHRFFDIFFRNPTVCLYRTAMMVSTGHLYNTCQHSGWMKYLIFPVLCASRAGIAKNLIIILFIHLQVAPFWTYYTD